MDDAFDQIIDFFKGQRNLYGDRLILTKPLSMDADLVELIDAPNIHKSIDNTKRVIVGNSDLDRYCNEIKSCKLCELGSLRTNFVFGTGNQNAKIMFIGEAPGKDEDLQGKPFVGRAGQLLTMMLAAIGLKREDVYIANILKCRPPNNRDPKPDEIEKCEPYLLKQIELIKPSLIVALGRISAASLLRIESSLAEMRKQVHKYNDVPLIVTYHPAALLRNPSWKKSAWEDLKKISKIIGN